MVKRDKGCLWSTKLELLGCMFDTVHDTTMISRLLSLSLVCTCALGIVNDFSSVKGQVTWWS
jgi:hypothetical protein